MCECISFLFRHIPEYMHCNDKNVSYAYNASAYL